VKEKQKEKKEERRSKRKSELEWKQREFENSFL
jgi:hypothetical protein